MLAILVFMLTLLFVIWQPKGLKIGTSAVAGALVALALGVVSIDDVFSVTNIVWDATLAFIGIILLSMVLDEIGFFEWAALHIIRLSGGSGVRLFVLILLLGAGVSALFANDGAALILTPILLAKMRLLNLDPKAVLAFLLAGGFIADSASNPLVISNLTNIVTAGYFNIGFWEYARAMFLPNLVSIVASIVVLYVFFRKAIPAQVSLTGLPEPMSVVKHMPLFKLSWGFLALLMVGYWLGDIYALPVSVFALGGGVLFLLLAGYLKAARVGLTLKTAPWQVVWFSVGLYVVVFGLKNAGLTDEIAVVLNWAIAQGQFTAVMVTGFMAAGISSVMNNMPTVMLMDIAITQTGNDMLAYANLLGCNLGPKMTPIGSLATLLWLHVLDKKGVHIGWWDYMKVGLVITPPVLFVALLPLALR
ncbi:MAG: arsenic transporter [Thiotrichales bacterium]|jgi:arsenical pump membrane protein|nr:arsenic transporter [Thiotrichales bacterium]